MSTTQQEVRELKEGRYMVVDEEPCRILSIDHSKPGKHGAAKARIEVVGLFSKKRASYIGSVTDKVQVPLIDKRTAQVIALMGDNVQLMDMQTYETFELPAPEDDEGEKVSLEPGKEIMYIEAMGRRKIMRI
ncbi:MAG TPA: translation initiation factor IF-5A [Candidatus Thermoplasmatota archaeon]|nr:translation initiation factor IF-5A [Candidatus Thermoplasmatota archaeon]